jgi:hypothetical protein
MGLGSLAGRRLSVVVAVAVGALAVTDLARAETVTFLPTGTEQTFTVPPGVTSLHAIAVGGRGGTGASNGGGGGFGALATADLPVTPGQVLYVEVGGNGPSDGSAGFNGGGTGGAGSSAAGGGGGGASDVRTAPRAAGSSLLTRLITAAGGGGGGGAAISGGDSGAEGGNAGMAGENSGGGGGQAGTTTTGGMPGAGACSGTQGQLGTGGAGGTLCSGAGGGGGGAGVYGGGGGGASSAGGGGGGGSSGFDPSATNTSVSVDNTGLPSITLTYTPSAGGGGVGGGGGGGGSTPPPDTTRPQGSALRLAPVAFRPLTRGGPVARVARGTLVTFRLSEAARVRFTVARARPGRRVGRRCVAPRRSNARRPRCTRYVSVRGSFTVAGVAGANRFRFSGRLAGRALRPGRHRLTGTPTDAAGNRGRPFSAGFTILR